MRFGGVCLLFLVACSSATSGDPAPSPDANVTPAPVCGDGVCVPSEIGSCAADCGGSAGACGNGTCDQGETTASCPNDCPAAASCGNGTCEAGENATNCPGDCAQQQAMCGNGTCETGETAANCPQDCGGGGDQCAANFDACFACELVEINEAAICAGTNPPMTLGDCDVCIFGI